MPEIYEGIVEIKSVHGKRGTVRKFPFTLKIRMIRSEPVLVREGHVQAVVDELNGEKIDIVNIQKIRLNLSLMPSVLPKYDVIVNEEDRSTIVVVPDYQLSPPLGRGQNACLAAKLTTGKLILKVKPMQEI